MQEYFLPGRGIHSLWDNPNTTNDGKAFRIQPEECCTVVDITGCGVIRKLWMTMDYLGKYLHAYYNETISDEPGLVHTVLPVIHGKGRCIGTHLGFRIKPENGLEWQHGGFQFT